MRLRAAAAALLTALLLQSASVGAGAEARESPSADAYINVSDLPGDIAAGLEGVFASPSPAPSESFAPVRGKPLEVTVPPTKPGLPSGVNTRPPFAKVDKSTPLLPPSPDASADAYLVLLEGPSSDGGGILEIPPPKPVPSPSASVAASPSASVAVSPSASVAVSPSGSLPPTGPSASSQAEPLELMGATTPNLNGDDDDAGVTLTGSLETSGEQGPDQGEAPAEPVLQGMREGGDGEVDPTSTTKVQAESKSTEAVQPTGASEAPLLFPRQSPGVAPDGAIAGLQGSPVATTTPSIVGYPALVPLEEAYESPEATLPPAQQQKDIWIEVPLLVANLSSDAFTPEFDSSIRSYAANATRTSDGDWKLVNLTSVSSQRNAPTSNWVAFYQASLPERGSRLRIAVFEELVADGSLDQHLRDATSEAGAIVRVAGAPVFGVDSQKPLVPSRATSGSEESAVGSGGSKEGAESSGGTNAPGVTKSKGKDKNNIGIILGTCLGALALALVGLAGFLFYRRRNASDEQHLIDGVAAAPSSITSAATSETGTSRYQTGAPVNPRGAHVLRNQSRILDWQLEHAEAAGNVQHVLGRTTHRESIGVEGQFRRASGNTNTETATLSSAQAFD